MFYDFPHITHINDVLPHITGREEFCFLNKGDYTAINYAVAFEETFKWDSDDPVGSAIRRECRGITFDSNGDLICRKYHKFFNIGEKEETQLNKVNLYEPHIVLQKLDGSLVVSQPSSNGFVLTTKAGVTEISQQAEDFIKDKPHYSTFIKKCIRKGITCLFEWCSNKNRIVISYPEDQLILTGMRYNNTGEYIDYEIMKNYATAWNIPVVQAVNGLAVQNIELFVKQVREWENEEGVVVRFSSGHMCKVKSADYVLRHKTKDSISREKNVIDCILQDAVDDLVPLLTPDDADRLQRFQKAFLAGLDEVACEMAELFVEGNKMYPNKKDFAVEFVQKKVLPIHVPIMYAMKSGRGAKEILIDMIKKSLSSQSKVDNVRWMFGGVNWNYIDKKEQ
jgi:RNA ligase